jgi:competence protein ComEC
VLKVSAAGASVLLTGDIESEAEYQLLTQQRTQLRADVLIAPHHGSDTSSTPGFVQAVAPRHVVISAGHRNRYRQPADIVLARYRAIDAKIWQTARHGSVRIEFDPIDGLTVTSYHDQSRRYWHRPRS